jgi:hypothetical protein
MPIINPRYTLPINLPNKTALIVEIEAIPSEAAHETVSLITIEKPTA